jgi:protein involved in polysaccharide export with SLBB domain
MRLAFLLSVLLSLSCGGMVASANAANRTEVGGGVRSADTGDYKLGSDDKIRVLIFDEPSLSGEYLVNANGVVSLPLIGETQAAGLTTAQLQEAIVAKLKPRYLLNPSVNIDVLTFRPFFVLGEVNKPGDYPYVVGLTALKAVAIAEGFTYRADKHHIYIKAAGQTGETRYDLTPNVFLRPGDTVRIGERYF